jgi:hypothetical protein
MGFLSELPLYGVRGSSSLCTPRLSLDVRTVHRGFIAPGIGWWPGGSLSVNPLPSGPPRPLRHFISPLFTNDLEDEFSEVRAKSLLVASYAWWKGLAS